MFDSCKFYDKIYKTFRGLFFSYELLVYNLHCFLLLEKAAELRAYLKSKGAEISEENSEGGLHIDLAQIIEACDVCLKEDDKGLC